MLRSLSLHTALQQPGLCGTPALPGTRRIWGRGEGQGLTARCCLHPARLALPRGCHRGCGEPRAACSSPGRVGKSVFKGCPPCPRGARPQRCRTETSGCRGPGGAAHLPLIPHPKGQGGLLLTGAPGTSQPRRARPRRPRSGPALPGSIPPGSFHPSLPPWLPGGRRRCPGAELAARVPGTAAGSERRRRPCKSCVPAGGKAGSGGRGKTTTPKCLHEFPSARPASEISPIRAVRGGSRLTFPHRFTVTFGRQAGTIERSAPELADLFGISLLSWRRAAAAGLCEGRN